MEPVSCVLLGSVWLNLGLPILFVIGLLGQVSRHGGCLHHCFEAALSLLDILLWVEDDDIDLGYVEHAQWHSGAQAHGHSQGCGLDEHLEKTQQLVNALLWIPWVPIKVQLIIHYVILHKLNKIFYMSFKAFYNAVFTVFIWKHSRRCLFPGEWFIKWCIQSRKKALFMCFDHVYPHCSSNCKSNSNNEKRLLLRSNPNKL